MLIFIYQSQGVAAQRQVDGLSIRSRLHFVVRYLLVSVVIYHASRVWLALFSFQALSMQVPHIFALAGCLLVWDRTDVKLLSSRPGPKHMVRVVLDTINSRHTVSAFHRGPCFVRASSIRLLAFGPSLAEFK